ncbi:hypothetical protein KPH14_000687, partial [Odynerus spinipes]
TSTSAWHRGR